MRDYGLVKVSDLKSMADSVRDLVGISSTLTVSQMASYVREYQEAFTLNAFMNKTYSASYIDFSLTYLAVNFNGQSKIPLISLPNLLSVADGVNFGNCYNLSELNIPLCSTNINGIVGNCSNLRKVTLGQYFLSNPIYSCYRLEELNMPRVSNIIGLFDGGGYNSNLVVSAPNLELMSNEVYNGTMYLPKFRRGTNEYRNQANAVGKVLDCPVCVSLFSSRTTAIITYLNVAKYAERVNFPLMSFYYASLFASNLSYFNCLYVDQLMIGDTKLSSIVGYNAFSYGSWGDYSNPSMNSNLSTIKMYGQYFNWFTSNNQVYAPCAGLESLYLYCSQVNITATYLVNTPIATSSYLGHYGSIYVPSYYWSYYSSKFSVLSRRLVSLTDEELECIPPYRYVNSTISFADVSALLTNKNTIGQYAFSGCSNLTSFSCSNIETVLPNAFYNCNNLSEINLPNAKYFGGGFTNTALISATLGVKNFNIIRNTLYSCPNLKTLRLNDMPFIDVFPQSVNNVTYPYPSLETLELDKCSAIYTGLGIFSNISSFIAPSLKYLSGTLVNLSKLSILSLPELASIDTIYNVSFPTNVEVINLPKLETSIYSMFTSNHTKLREVYLDKCPALNPYAFYCCYSLSLISIPNCKSVGQMVFYNCSSLTSIDLPNVEYIGTNAFSTCLNLVSVSLSKCKTIETSAFYGCTSLADINLDMVEYIGQGALQNCPNLSSVNLTNCKTLLANNFIGTQITELYLPECSTLGMLNGNIYSVYAPKLSSITAWTNLSYFRTDASQFGTYPVNYVKEFVGSNLSSVPYFASSASATLISCTLGECHFSGSVFYRIGTLQTFSGKILEMSGNGCFCGCYQLSSVDTRYVSRISYPKYGNIISWEYGAMWGCKTLTELKFINLEEVQDGNLFYGCSNLSVIYCLSKSVVTDMVPNPHWRSSSGTMSVEHVRCYEDTPFSNIGTEAHFYVPEVLAQDYWRLCNNDVFRNKIEALPMSRVKEEYDLAGIPFPTEWLSLI